VSIFEHGRRYRVFNPSQHPLKHDISDFSYGNARLPNVSLLGDAMDYIIASIYPNYKGTVATPAALPGTATAADYYVVTDDGDGKSAGYVWSTIDGVGQWVKRYDADWSAEGILAEAVDRTMPMYVHKYGFDDHDPAAAYAPFTGLNAGQHIYGGKSASTNLTLHANSGDTGGARSGFIQLDDSARPTVNNTLDLGTTALRFRTLYVATSVVAGTLTMAPGSITDSSGAISFSATNLTTTGSISAGSFSAGSSLDVGTLHLASGSITDSSGAISFDDENLTTTGYIEGGGGLLAGASGSYLILNPGSITDESGAIDFGNMTFTSVGTLSAGNTTVTQLDSDNIRLSGNTISITNSDGDLTLMANGLGVMHFLSDVFCSSSISAGAGVSCAQLIVDNLLLDGNTISSRNTNGNVILDPDGTGLVELSSGFFPTTDSVWDIGKTGKVWNKLWIDGSIGGAVDEITITDLMTLRSVPYRDTGRTQPAQAGDSLFWDGSKWLASAPDTEIIHSSVSGLTTGDAGHTQFVMLAGRAGGQAIQGGTAASEFLTLESTAHASKGSIRFKDNLIPFTNASFSVTWSGTDLGDSTHYLRDVYTKGVFKGLRLENYTSGTLPAASASAPGRLVFSTDNNKIYVDNGGAWVVAGVGKFQSDTVWNGTDVTKDVTVSSTITDARTGIWQLCDNSNNYERIFCSIQTISASVVRITVNTPLPAGSYRLIGLE
jgi:hypothetical protein